MANRTLNQLGAEVYSRLGETSGFYTDAEIKQWLNDGVQDVCLQIEPLVSSTTASVVATTAEYAVTSTAINIRQVHHGGSGAWVVLKQTTYESLFESVSDWEDSTGTPTHWYWRQDTLGLYPTPDTNLSGGLRYLYTYLPAALSTGSDTTGLPEILDRAVIAYATYRCLDKDSGRNPQRAASALQEYARQLNQAGRVLNKQKKDHGPRFAPAMAPYRLYYQSARTGVNMTTSS